MIALSLPFPPSANRLWRSTRGQKGVYPSAAYKSWKALADLCIPEDCRGKVRGPHTLEILVERPDRRARDLDNILKATVDALKDMTFQRQVVKQGVIRDDSDTRQIIITWASDEPSKEPHVHVRVTPLAA